MLIASIIVWLVAAAAFAGATIYVALHFLVKFW